MIKGAYAYIWNGASVAGGDLDTIHQMAKTYHFGELWKGDDGGNWYQQPQPLSVITDSANQSGVPVASWGYHYGDDKGNECQRVIDTIEACTIDFYALNNEAEYQGKWQAAQWVAQTLRAKYPTFDFASACLPVPRYHPSSPYRQWADSGFVQAPELYWSMFRGTVIAATRHAEAVLGVTGRFLTFEGAGLKFTLPQVPLLMERASGSTLLDAAGVVQVWEEDCTAYNLPQNPYVASYMDAPLAAASYTCTDAEMVAFLAALDPKRVQSIWVWDLQHMDAAALVRFQKVSEWLSSQEPDHRIQDLLAQAKALYSAANDFLAPVIAQLEAA